MRKWIIAAIIVVAIVGVVTSVVISTKRNNNQDVKSLTTVRVNEVTRSVFYSPQYVAIALGYFEEKGIKVELTTGQGADKVMTAVLSGQSDIGFAGPEASIYVYNEGKEDHTQVFAQLTKRDGSFLVARNKPEKFDWNQLKGTTVIPGRKGGVPYMTFEYVLKQKGLDTSKDLVLDDSISFDLMAGAFAGGNAEYVTLFEPTASMTQDAGKGYIVASVGEAAGEVPYTAYCAKKSYIAQNSDIIEGFTKAIYKGEQYVKEHTAQEIAEKIQNYFPDTTLESLTKSVQTYKDIEAWKENPILKEEAFDKLQEIMTMAGELTQKAPYEKIVNNSYAEKVIK